MKSGRALFLPKKRADTLLHRLAADIGNGKVIGKSPVVFGAIADLHKAKTPKNTKQKWRKTQNKNAEKHKIELAKMIKSG